MKKLIALLLTLAMMLALVACVKPDNKPDDGNKPGDGTTETPDTGDTDDGDTDGELSVMTYEEYVAAELQSEVLVEVYVQAHQAWWFNSKVNHGVITVYAADHDGGYFLYEMECAEEDAAKLVPGTKILVHGIKAEWAGEIEIIEATFEFVDDAPYIAEAVNLTDLLGSEILISFQNQYALFEGLTVVSIEYQNGAPGKDIYVKLSLNGIEYSFCVESYLTSPGSDLYKAVEELKAGDVIDVTGFVYWYEGVNTHITGITVK